MWNRYAVKQQGLLNFKANYWPCVAAAVLLSLTEIINSASAGSNGSSSGYEDGITSILSSMIGIIAALIGIAIILMILNPLKVGCRRFFLVNQLKPAQLGNIKYPFVTNYTNVAITMFMTYLFIALWTLLLIVPGIIKSYEYRMVEYILAEDSSIDFREAQLRSKAMMNGHKMDTFVYDLSFIGWYILGACTCGLAQLFYVAPYKASSDAALYVAIRSCSNVMSSSAEA